jgi:hypothetical protein
MNVREIIAMCGGPAAVHAESVRLHKVDRYLYAEAGLKSVYKWLDSGIPEKHWPVIMTMAAVTERDLHQANREARRRVRPRKRALARAA